MPSAVKIGESDLKGSTIHYPISRPIIKIVGVLGKLNIKRRNEQKLTTAF